MLWRSVGLKMPVHAKFWRTWNWTRKVGQINLVFGSWSRLIRRCVTGMSARYKSLCAAVTICATLVNIQTHRDSIWSAYMPAQPAELKIHNGEWDQCQGKKSLRQRKQWLKVRKEWTEPWPPARVGLHRIPCLYSPMPIKPIGYPLKQSNSLSVYTRCKCTYWSSSLTAWWHKSISVYGWNMTLLTALKAVMQRMNFQWHLSQYTCNSSQPPKRIKNHNFRAVGGAKKCYHWLTTVLNQWSFSSRQKDFNRKPLPEHISSSTNKVGILIRQCVCHNERQWVALAGRPAGQISRRSISDASATWAAPYSSRRGATYHDISRGFPHLFRKVKQPHIHRLWPT